MVNEKREAVLLKTPKLGVSISRSPDDQEAANLVNSLIEEVGLDVTLEIVEEPVGSATPWLQAGRPTMRGIDAIKELIEQERLLHW